MGCRYDIVSGSGEKSYLARPARLTVWHRNAPKSTLFGRLTRALEVLATANTKLTNYLRLFRANKCVIFFVRCFVCGNLEYVREEFIIPLAAGGKKSLIDNRWRGTRRDPPPTDGAEIGLCAVKSLLPGLGGWELQSG